MLMNAENGGPCVSSPLITPFEACSGAKAVVVHGFNVVAPLPIQMLGQSGSQLTLFNLPTTLDFLPARM